MADDKWMQKASESMKERGTVGSFTEWCKRNGFESTTCACVSKGLASKNAAIRKKAGFAKAVKGCG